jgi:hypothetical protein
LVKIIEHFFISRQVSSRPISSHFAPYFTAQDQVFLMRT